MIGFMRVFLGAAKDRLEVLSLSPSASVSSHLRALALALTILVYDTFGTIAIISSLDTMSLTKVRIHSQSHEVKSISLVCTPLLCMFV
jgi:autocrine motility factor receptor